MFCRCGNFRLVQVKYAPKVSVSAIGGTMSDGRIAEGSDVKYKCHADANPPEVTYRWYINEELVIGDFTTEMVSGRIKVCTVHRTQ